MASVATRTAGVRYDLRIVKDRLWTIAAWLPASVLTAILIGWLAALWMGGLAAVKPYYRFIWMPGVGHGPWNGTANAAIVPPVPAIGQFYGMLKAWVEKGEPPEGAVFTSAAYEQSPGAVHKTVAPGPEISLPGCTYPTLATYVAGDIRKAASYACR